ncbi:MAG TPA: tetratricopeptide repeat protein [Candidatus Udaeobacter sp.]|nr:tetratricopeptide repeat protein [Candidatus Udaeobacter sp.]
MRLWGMAAVAALVLASLAAIAFAADNVAPTKAELEEMYNAAYRAFDSKKFPEALKQLDAIDARQPDLAASKNLRGVILMRQGKYDEAETALQDAARIDPKFWNARFNLAEIPFLKKDWAEARKRFEQLLSTGASDLAKEASQLIQYKILLTYLQEGNGNMVDSMLAKLELSPDTPAVDYVKAAVALQQKNQSEAKDWISAAEKNYSPQLNKLFAESLYEVGWLEKPVGEGRPSLPLMTAAERSEKTKAAARSKFEQSQQALRQGDFATALKLIDEADKVDPNKPAILNLRGEILMQQQQFDQAEAAFKKAARLDPKLREAQYNLAQIPFKKKDYAKAQERFEALYNRMPGGDKNQAAELIKFKIYMTLLLEGKESRAHTMMEEFQFTGDTPALYYAQAAWEYKHNNPEKAADWTGSANKIYSPALNTVFADAFYDVGWMQRPEGSTAPALAFDTTNVVAPQVEGGPAVEPSPIAANKQGETSSGETLALGSAAKEPNAGMEIASADATAGQPPTSVSSESSAGTSPQPQQPPSESPPVGGESTTTAAQAVGAETPQASSPSSEQNNQQVPVQTSPSEKPAAAPVPANISSTATTGVASRRLAIVGGLLLAAIIILAWVIVPVVRRHAFNVPRHLRLEPPAQPPAEAIADGGTAVFRPKVAPTQTSSVQENGFVGGPRQVSVELKPWQAPLRHSALPARKPSGTFDRLKERRAKTTQTPVRREPERELTPIAEPDFESCVGEVVEQTPDIQQPSIPQAAEMVTASATSEFAEVSAIVPQQPDEISGDGEAATFYTQEPGEFFGDSKQSVLPVEAPGAEAFAGAEFAWPAVEPSAEFAVEPIAQELPDQITSTANQFPLSEPATESVYDFPSAISSEPVFPQITTPVTMPETTQTPIAPIHKAPAPPVAKPQPPTATMQTSVQLTFSFEIAAMQLTPSFKMGVLKVRPISKLVTMRLPSPQRAQSALNLQVAFEIVKIQPVAGAIGTIRVVPSQQQRPTLTGMPSIAVAGLQIVPNSETAPVQLTPSPQGRASVFITVPFQISTLEFSPSLEIASVILNSNSKQVIVQLPGAGPSPAEGAPMFEIANLELNETGDIAMMQLNLLGGPKRA